MRRKQMKKSKGTIVAKMGIKMLWNATDFKIYFNQATQSFKKNVQ
jgi:hypothetical protein